MKKAILFLILLILIISLIGCTNEVTKPPSNTDAINTPSSTTQEAIQTPTPKPTLSEEEKKNNNKYNELLSYCTTYNDWYAASLIRDMFAECKISEEQYKQLFSINTFFDAKDFDDKLWSDIKEHIESLLGVINGKPDGLDEAGVQKFYEDICKASRQKTVYISLLDSKEKRERVIQGIESINHWIKEPNESNFVLVKQMLLSDDLTPGEKILLNCHLLYNPDLPDQVEFNEKQLEIIEFLNENGLKDYAEKACEDLLTLINSN